MIIQRKYHSSEITLHIFLPHQIALFYRLRNSRYFIRFQPIFYQATFVFIFLIVSLSAGIMKSNIQVPPGTENVIKKQLIMSLPIYIQLIFIKTDYLALLIFNFSIRIVSTVCIQSFPGNAIPGVISLFLATESDQFQSSMISVITSLRKIGFQFSRSPVPVPVTSDMRKPQIKSPAIV